MESYGGYNIAVILFAAIGSLLSGYGLAVIIATLGQPTFYTSLHLVADPKAPGYGHTNTVTATVQGIFFAGGFLGCLFAGFVGAKLGRIQGFRIAAAIAVFGGSLQTGAKNEAMYIVARFITGFATGHAIAAVPVYFAEVAPPHSRGLMGGAHGCFINVGYAVANWVGFGTYNSHNGSFGWRFPNAVLVIIALFFAAGTFFIPESPRWLVSNGRDDEALYILRRLHRDPKDPEDIFAHQELGLIKKQIAEDNHQMQLHGKWQIITQKTYRIRLILGCLVIIGTQNTAVLVINQYNASLYQSLGLSNSEALIVSAGYNTWAMVSNFMGATISDRLGRRRALLIGFISNLIMLSISTGLIARYSEVQTKAWAALSLTFLFLYVFCYACFIDVNCWTYASEIFPSHLRASGTAITLSCFMLTDLLWLQLAPTASAKIGWKYYLVFVCLTVVHTIYYWFRLPETSGLALEEIDRLFGKEPAGHVDDADLGLEGVKEKDLYVQEVPQSNLRE